MVMLHNDLNVHVLLKLIDNSYGFTLSNNGKASRPPLLIISPQSNMIFF
jgi:hypothetical protein